MKAADMLGGLPGPKAFCRFTRNRVRQRGPCQDGDVPSAGKVDAEITRLFLFEVTASMPPRSRNFDGCWTCRSRKLKCDATRPKCLRCAKANLVCKGYNIVLVWADNVTIGEDNEMMFVPMGRDAETQRDSGSLRRNVDLVKFPPTMIYDTYEELNKAVSQFDTIGGVKSRSFVLGPFSVYPILLDTPRESSTISQKTPNEATIRTRKRPQELVALSGENLNGTKKLLLESKIELDTASQEHISSHHRGSYKQHSPSQGALAGEFANRPRSSLDTDSEGSLPSLTDNAYVHYELLELTKLTVLAIKGLRYKFSEQGMLHILYPNFFPNIESDNWKPSSDILLSCVLRNDTGQVVLSPILHTVMTYLQSGVLAFTRVSRSMSCWNTLVIPFLKQIFFDIVLEEYPTHEGWQNLIIPKNLDEVPRNLLIRNIKLAIFCLAISISFYVKSLSGSRTESSPNSFHVNDDLRRSIELRKFGIIILNYHLDEYHDNSKPAPDEGYDCYFLLALILQIQADKIFEVFENFELIYAIGDFILKKPVPHHKHMSPVERHLRRMFHILNVFYESTQAINLFNYSIPENDKESKYLDLNENYDLTGDVSDVEDDSSVASDADSEVMDFESNVNVASSNNSSGALSLMVNFASKRPNPKAESFSDIQALYAQMNELPEGRPLNSSFPSPITPRENNGSIYLDIGIPKSLIRLFYETIQLTNHKNVFKSTGVTPRNFPRICAEIQDRIVSWRVESHWRLYENEYNPVSNVTTRIFLSDFHQGLYHNVISFHNALKVYFKRLILDSPNERYQSHIEACFSSIKQLVALTQKLKTERKSLLFHPSFWPLLICGCDIDIENRPDLKEACQQLWKSPCFNSHNNWRSKQILYEVWHRRLESKEFHGFMDMIREWAIVLSLG